MAQLAKKGGASTNNQNGKRKSGIALVEQPGTGIEGLEEGGEASNEDPKKGGVKER